MRLFSPEELEAIRLSDAQIDADFCQTQEEIEESRKRDRSAVLDRMDEKKRKAAAAQKAYREANRDKAAAAQRDILISFRKRHGYTQKTLSCVLGVSQPLVAQWETRSIPVNLDTIGATLPDLAEELRIGLAVQ